MIKKSMYFYKDLKFIRKNMNAPEEHNIMKVTMKNRNKINKVTFGLFIFLVICVGKHIL